MTSIHFGSLKLAATVVLKGKVPSQDILDKMVSVAKGVDGTDAVDTQAG